MSSKEPEFCIFIPTYNEIKNVEEIHRRIRAEFPHVNVLFIDDGSPDGTGAKLDEIAKADGHITVVHREGKKGIGSAHKEAIRWAYQNSMELLLTMDSDLTHKPEEIVKFRKTLGIHDVTVGSRFLSSHGIAEWPLGRRLITKTGHVLTRCLLGTSVDATGAFRLYDLRRIQPEIFGCINSDDYAFFYESIKILQVAGMNVGEVPVTLSARFRGHSKMKLSDMFRGFAYLILFAVRIRFPKSKINQQITNLL